MKTIIINACVIAVFARHTIWLNKFCLKSCIHFPQIFVNHEIQITDIHDPIQMFQWQISMFYQR